MYNFTVGPVRMDPDIVEIGNSELPYFRTDSFSKIVFETEVLIKKLLNTSASSRAIFLTGSGTLSMEASLCNVFSVEDRILIVNGGTFGSRLCEIARRHEIPFEELRLSDGESLKKHHFDPFEGGDYSGVVINHHETSTGVLYDLDLVRSFCRTHDALFVVDAISSFISDELDVSALQIDVVILSSHKALALSPGLSIVVISQKAKEKLIKVKSKILYFDFKAALKEGERGQTPFTPAVGIILQLNVRLKKIDKLGLTQERAKIEAIATDFRRRIKEFDVDISSCSLSNTLTPIILRHTSAYSLYKSLCIEYDIWTAPSGGERKHKLLRIGHIGMLTIDDNDRLFDALAELKEKDKL